MIEFKKPEFHCTCCGLCCRVVGRISKELDRGDLVCKYLNEDTNLCDIYEERPIFCRIIEGKPEGITMKDWLKLNYEGCNELQEEHRLGKI